MAVPGWNIFRILGDCSHLLSKIILMVQIHRNRSAEGVSMITQILYAVVFCSRYTDIFRETHAWNIIFKIFYIASSFYIVAIMYWRFPRTREREVAWKLGGAALAVSVLLSPFTMLIFEDHWSLRIWLWDFSQILESICVLPQLLLLRQTSVPTVIDSFYLLALASYRALYLLNWIWRGLDTNDRHPNAVSIIFGVIQTALYIDFFWVYYSRQRVKLRNGGIVDADDMNRGWLLNRIFGNRRFQANDNDGDEESAPALGGRGQDAGAGNARRSKWGSRGISISADDTTYEQESGIGPRAGGSSFTDAPVDPDAKISDPDDLARALDDEESDSESDEDSSEDERPSGSNGQRSGVTNGSEWRAS
ncbi:ER lumen protein retaining receptor-domain-containing protein [Microdochium bolleyi]|uniref:ER lumen protein retaining receptor-domain-containing protein n=1 Tax=Microdochium bolleyi TaxID=196109 RepID=A0A136J2Z1_9PEZI|nr:ER lumen protein retaining receptor-domain-containing protein [Microdochium bolleyi]